MAQTITIKVKDFTTTPGPRYREQGQYSGQEYYETKLKPIFDHLQPDDQIKIELDGTRGYPSSFLSEAFGRLYKNLANKNIWKQITFISQDDPYQIEFIERQIKKYDN